jgi:hypothetical protein
MGSSPHCSRLDHTDEAPWIHEIPGARRRLGRGHHRAYPKPPDLRAAETQNKTDGELYYTIANGIRLSGMPAFSEIHTTEKAWRLVLFIRHLPQITPEELDEMKGLNRKPQANPKDF